MASAAVSSSIGERAESSELRLLFHQLNNQLGVILAHAELLEAKATEGGTRARAALVVTTVLEAMGTTRQIRDRACDERALPAD